MVTLEEAIAGSESGAQPRWFLKPDVALGHLKAVSFDAEGVAQLRHGQPTRGIGETPETGRRARLYGPDAGFLGLGEALADGRIQPRRLILISGS
jgi:tRNA pseudouridine55 synthase